MCIRDNFFILFECRNIYVQVIIEKLRNLRKETFIINLLSQNEIRFLKVKTGNYS